MVTESVVESTDRASYFPFPTGSSHPSPDDILDSLLYSLRETLLHHEPAFQRLARATLAKVRQIQAAQHDIGPLIDRVGRMLQMSAEELKGPSRTQRIAARRHIAVYLIRRIYGTSYPQLARAFNRHDHSVSMHSCRLIEQRMDREPQFRRRLEQLEAQITGPGGAERPACDIAGLSKAA